MRTRRGIGWALAVAMAVLAAGVACAEAATASSPSPVPATVPGALQALEAKMRELQVDSERFSQVSRGYVTVANEENGKVVGRVKHVSQNTRLTVATSLSPQMSEAFSGPRHTPTRIVIGSTLYVRAGKRRRHWVRTEEPQAARFYASYPFHGDPEEVDLGGTGSYAGLLNLLATATGPIVTEPPATIEGQAVDVFSATVEPLRLVKGLTQEDESTLRRHPIIEHLEVFLTEAGLPSKVVQTIHAADIHETIVTQILVINVPINVEAPPSSEIQEPPRHKRSPPRHRR